MASWGAGAAGGLIQQVLVPEAWGRFRYQAGGLWLPCPCPSTNYQGIDLKSDRGPTMLQQWKRIMRRVFKQNFAVSTQTFHPLVLAGEVHLLDFEDIRTPSLVWKWLGTRSQRRDLWCDSKR